MITEALQAWIIHKTWSGDTSARVLFFTSEFGVVSCFYKGARLPKKQALLQAFMPLWLILDIRGSAHYVRSLEYAAPPIPLYGQSLLAGLYLNELLYLAIRQQDPNPALHAAYTHTVQALMSASDRYAIERALRRFEWTLLSTCGYGISWTHEASSTQPIRATGKYRFLPEEGFVVAEEGFLGEHILALAQDKLDEKPVLSVAKRIMRQAIHHVLDGREIQSRVLGVRSTSAQI